MSKFVKMTAIAAVIAGMSGVAHADPAETKGGIKVKTEDGRFEASIGGRIHFDVNMFSEDDDAAYGSIGAQNAGGTYIRRAYITLKGKAYGWNYKIEPDFAPRTDTGATQTAFQDVMISTNLGPGEIIIGQIKPFRAMEELTSSNDLVFIERPFASAAGIFSGREFQQGLFYRAELADMFTVSGGVHSLRGNTGAITEGTGGEGRVTVAPFKADGAVLHTGLSYSVEHPQAASVAPTFVYGGRRGPALNPYAGATASIAGQDVNTLTAELAGTFGPVYAQAEYMTQKTDRAAGSTPADLSVDAWYVQASYFITGETKPYKFKEGVFSTPKPNNDFGAIEVAVRYEQGRSKDESSTSNFCGSSIGAATATPLGNIPGAAANSPSCEVKQITVGTNWYVNPNLRFMLNYYLAEADLGLNGLANTNEDKPKALVLRTQFSF